MHSPLMQVCQFREKGRVMTKDEFGKVCFKEKLEEEWLLETKIGKGSSRIQVLT